MLIRDSEIWQSAANFVYKLRFTGGMTRTSPGAFQPDVENEWSLQITRKADAGEGQAANTNKEVSFAENLVTLLNLHELLIKFNIDHFVFESKVPDEYVKFRHILPSGWELLIVEGGNCSQHLVFVNKSNGVGFKLTFNSGVKNGS